VGEHQLIPAAHTRYFYAGLTYVPREDGAPATSALGCLWRPPPRVVAEGGRLYSALFVGGLATCDIVNIPA
jgi:hypothetical protein